MLEHILDRANFERVSLVNGRLRVPSGQGHVLIRDILNSANAQLREFRVLITVMFMKIKNADWFRHLPNYHPAWFQNSVIVHPQRVLTSPPSLLLFNAILHVRLGECVPDFRRNELLDLFKATGMNFIKEWDGFGISRGSINHGFPMCFFVCMHMLSPGKWQWVTGSTAPSFRNFSHAHAFFRQLRAEKLSQDMDMLMQKASQHFQELDGRNSKANRERSIQDAKLSPHFMGRLSCSGIAYGPELTPKQPCCYCQGTIGYGQIMTWPDSERAANLEKYGWTHSTAGASICAEVEGCQICANLELAARRAMFQGL